VRAPASASSGSAMGSADGPIKQSIGPTRTCVGCRERTVASRLLRVVAVGSCVVPDPRRRRPGRGAWVHPDVVCVESATRRKAFGRAFGVRGALDAAAVREQVEQWQQPRGPATGPQAKAGRSG